MAGRRSPLPAQPLTSSTRGSVRMEPSSAADTRVHGTTRSPAGGEAQADWRNAIEHSLLGWVDLAVSKQQTSVAADREVPSRAPVAMCAGRVTLVHVQEGRAGPHPGEGHAGPCPGAPCWTTSWEGPCSSEGHTGSHPRDGCVGPRPAFQWASLLYFHAVEEVGTGRPL